MVSAITRPPMKQNGCDTCEIALRHPPRDEFALVHVCEIPAENKEGKRKHVGSSHGSGKARVDARRGIERMPSSIRRRSTTSSTFSIMWTRTRTVSSPSTSSRESFSRLAEVVNPNKEEHMTLDVVIHFFQIRPLDKDEE